MYNSFLSRRQFFLQSAAITALSLVAGVPAQAGSETASSKSIVIKPARILDHDAYPLPFRRALPLSAPRARYPQLPSGRSLLKKGSIRREGALPLPCDIIFERDVPLKLRDGVTIYTDLFRPAKPGRFPALVAWSPYGKDIGGQWLDDVPHRSRVPRGWVSDFQKFEGPDPAFWVSHGYVVLNPDARGAGKSEGDITFWGRQLAEDGADFIAWAARQSWCSGKVGMSGNSWLAASQWFVAAENPPHLAAIAPWEGFCDSFRDNSCRGGIPSPAFPEAIITTLSGTSRVEDMPRMIAGMRHYDAYWADKRAAVEKIRIPAYVVSSYTNAAHTHGTFDAWARLGSAEKWLRVHNTNEWYDSYTPAHAMELCRFFDHYLKGAENGWQKTPQVRISVLDPGGKDTVNRVVPAWPPQPDAVRKYYLHTDNTLSRKAAPEAGVLSYEVGPKGAAVFALTMAEACEIIGYMKLRLWVEAQGSDDMDLLVRLEKRDAQNHPLICDLPEGRRGPFVVTGMLRASMRALDAGRSAPAQPFHTFRRATPLKAGEIVPLEIGLWPAGLRFHAGEKLVLTISPLPSLPTSLDMGFGTAIVEIPADGGSYMPGHQTKMLKLGGAPSTTPAFVNAQRVATPKSHNRGRHVLHLGGKYDSHLLIPLSAVKL